MPGFADLPLEVRIGVYRYLFEGIRIKPRPRPKVANIQWRESSRSRLAMLWVSSRYYAEARDAMLSQATVLMRSDLDMELFNRARTPTHLVRRLHFHIGDGRATTSGCIDLISRSPNLRRVIFTIVNHIARRQLSLEEAAARTALVEEREDNNDYDDLRNIVRTMFPSMSMGTGMATRSLKLFPNIRLTLTVVQEF